MWLAEDRPRVAELRKTHRPLDGTGDRHPLALVGVPVVLGPVPKGDDAPSAWVETWVSDLWWWGLPAAEIRVLLPLSEDERNIRMTNLKLQRSNSAEAPWFCGIKKLEKFT